MTTSDKATADMPQILYIQEESSTATPRDRFLVKPGPLDVTLSVLPGHTVTVQVTYSDQLAGGACVQCGERVDHAVVSFVGSVIAELPHAHSWYRIPVVHATCEEAWLARVFPASDPNSPALLADYRHREKIALELGRYAADQEAYYDSLPEDDRPNFTGRSWAGDALDEAAHVIRFGYVPTPAKVA